MGVTRQKSPHFLFHCHHNPKKPASFRAQTATKKQVKLREAYAIVIEVESDRNRR